MSINETSGQLVGMKKQFVSKGVIGAVIVVLSGVANLIGYTVNDAEQANITDLLDILLYTAGGVLAWYGRVVATKRIS